MSTSSTRYTRSHFIVRGKLTLQAITLTTSRDPADVRFWGSYYAYERMGGVACIGGTFVMEAGSEISNCVGQESGDLGSDSFSDSGGGGVFVVNAGRFVMNGGTITRCYSDRCGGGGVSLQNGASMEMNGGSIIGNRTNAYGGGIADIFRRTFTQTVTINGGRIANNTAKESGGGIGAHENSGSSFVLQIRGGTIENNIAGGGGGAYAGAGGGVYANNVSMSGGSIINNSAAHDGGGLCVSDQLSNMYTHRIFGAGGSQEAVPESQGVWERGNQREPCGIHLSPSGQSYSVRSLRPRHSFRQR